MRLDHLLSKEKVGVVLLFGFQFPVAMRIRGTPVPIPNTMVKTYAAEDTVPATVRENRWLLEQIWRAFGLSGIKE